MENKRIWTVVALVHTVLLFWVIFANPITAKKIPPQKTIVRVFDAPLSRQQESASLAFLEEAIAMIPSPPAIEEEEEETPSAPEPEPVVETTPPPPAPVVEKPTIEKKPKKSQTAAPAAKVTPKPTPAKTPPKKEVAKKTPPTKSTSKTTTQSSSQKQKVLSMMQKSLDQINRTSSKLGSSPKGGSMRPAIETLASEGLTLSASEMNYQEKLISYLKYLLELPETGEVKMRLTLKNDGHVASVTILSSTSDKNKKYIEKTLPTLAFPAFDEGLKKEKEHTFPLLLSGGFSH